MGKANLDTVPSEVWTRVREIMVSQSMSTADMRRAGAPIGQGGHGVSRRRLAEIAAVLDSSELSILATNDVFWDTVRAVEPLGEQPVFDATVHGHA